MSDTDSPLQTMRAVGPLIFVIPLLMMFLMIFMMGGMMGPMGGPTFFVIPPLLLALGAGYVGYTLLTSDTEQGEVSTDDTSDPIERIQEQYTRGDLTEAELEQQLERHLGDDTSSESIEKSSLDTTNSSETEFER